MTLFILPGWSILSLHQKVQTRCRLIIKLSQSIDFTASPCHCMQSAPADEQYFYHYHILSFLCSKIMLCKRCKQGVKQAFHTQKTAYLSHSWLYSQILLWQMNNHSLSYLSLLPLHFSTGYLASFLLILLLMISSSSRPSSSSILRQ